MFLFLKKDYHFLLLLLLCWLLAEWLVNPVGDFPLNDDFSYGRSVHNLVVEGKLAFDKWLSMTLMTQVLWGAGFCKLFGFSFNVLRLSVVVLGYAGAAGCYFVAREMGKSKRLALLVALLVTFNPFLFSLSNSFMTDVPFFTFSVFTSLFYLKALRTGRSSMVALGLFFGLAAIFVRQTGLMLPAAFAVAWMLRQRFSLKQFPTAIFPLAISLLLFFLYSNWFENHQGLPDGYGTFHKLFKRLGDANFFWVAFYRSGILWTYLGWFFLPLLAIFLLTGKTGWHSNRTKQLMMLAVLLVVTASFIPAWDLLPFGNLLYNLGLGPKLLKDGQFFINVFPQLPLWPWVIWKLIGMLAGLLLLLFFLKGIFANLRKGEAYCPQVVFALINIILFVSFLMLDMHFFDRYYFQLLPFLLVVILPLIGNRLELQNNRYHLFVRPFAVTTLVAMALFSVASTHDYFAWNRARWQALDYLTETKGIHPNRMDGGFEFNGWHKPGERNYDSPKSWWWVERDDYAVMFGPLEGFEKEQGFAFKRWVPPGVDSVYIFRKLD